MERTYSTEELKDAGASDAFVSIYLSSANGRHHIRQELDNGYPGTVMARGGDPSDGAGGFFSKLWNGDVFDAFLHADASNARMMLDVLGAEEIRDHGVDQGGYQIEWATTMVNEKAERHGREAV